jgi:hypothetical protein
VKLQPGEIVDITIKGARVVRVITEGHDGDVTPILDLTILGPDGSHYYTQLPADWSSVTVERVTPEHWPPRPGDVWTEADGTGTWVALADQQLNRVVLVSAEMTHGVPFPYPADDVLGTRGSLTLSHRESEGAGS